MYPSQKHRPHTYFTVLLIVVALYTVLELFPLFWSQSHVCSIKRCCAVVSLTAYLQRDYTGKMGFNEFKELFAVLNGWKQNFVMVDRDGSGTVEGHELSQCITNMGETECTPLQNIEIKFYLNRLKCN